MYTTALYILPEIIITIMSCFILILDAFISEKRNNIIYYLTQITLLITTACLILLTKESRCYLFYGSFVFDYYSIILKISVLLITITIFIYSKKYLKIIDLFKGEYFVLCLLSVLGMMIIISSGSFLILYLGLELLSLPLYSLIIMNKSKLSSEASIKYFVMGSIASGIFLFGVSIVYGMTGSIDLLTISKIITDCSEFSHMTVEYGLIFVISGLVFKFGAAPFHMWVPDVYEGSPIPITLFISTIPKIASLGMAYRLIVDTFSTLLEQYGFLFILTGVASVFIGNIFALSQNNIKRLLGYSAIAHVGFIFFAFIISDSTEFHVITFYILMYIISLMPVFCILMAFSNKTEEINLISHFKGFSFKNPSLAIIMLLSMFSLAGVPPTAGFYAKFFILKNLVSYGYIELAVFSVIMSVIGAFYYLKIIKTMYFENSDSEIKIVGLSDFALFLLSLNGILILFFGMFPAILLNKFILY